MKEMLANEDVTYQHGSEMFADALDDTSITSRSSTSSKATFTSVPDPTVSPIPIVAQSASTPQQPTQPASTRTVWLKPREIGGGVRLIDFDKKVDFDVSDVSDFADGDGYDNILVKKKSTPPGWGVGTTLEARVKFQTKKQKAEEASNAAAAAAAAAAKKAAAEAAAAAAVAKKGKKASKKAKKAKQKKEAKQEKDAATAAAKKLAAQAKVIKDLEAQLKSAAETETKLKASEAESTETATKLKASEVKAKALDSNLKVVQKAFDGLFQDTSKFNAIRQQSEALRIAQVKVEGKLAKTLSTPYPKLT